jgi:hypothetical protein
MNKLTAPENTTLDKAVDRYMSNLERLRTLFRLEKMANERSTYLNACNQAFRRELLQATDAKEPRAASKCFEILVEWCETARTRLRLLPEDLRGGFYSQLAPVFTTMLRVATKDSGDPAEIFDKQLKEVHRKFPATTAELQVTNGPISTVLENAARSVNTFNTKKK